MGFLFKMIDYFNQNENFWAFQAHCHLINLCYEAFID